MLKRAKSEMVIFFVLCSFTDQKFNQEQLALFAKEAITSFALCKWNNQERFAPLQKELQ